MISLMNKLFTISVIVSFLFGLGNFKEIEDNNNVTNCINDLNKNFERNPRNSQHNFRNYIVSVFLLGEIKTHYGRLYAFYICEFFETDNTFLSPLSYCARVQEQRTQCLQKLNKNGYTKLLSQKHALVNTILNIRYGYVDNNKFMKKYVINVFDHLVPKNVKFFADFCQENVDKQIDFCKSDIERDFNGIEHVKSCAQHAMRYKKKSQMLTLYGELFYIELHDNLRLGISTKTPKEYCNKSSSDENVDTAFKACLDNFKKENYNIEEDDPYFSLLHTFYNIVVDDTTDDVKKYIEEITLVGFEMKNEINDVNTFCTNLVKYELSSTNIYPFEKQGYPLVLL